MNIKKAFFCAVCLVLFTANSYALNNQARIITSELLAISSSGRSVILDRGSFEGLKVGTKARLLEQRGTMEKPVLRFIAYAEAIKVQEKTSFWVLSELSPNALPRPGSRVAFLTEEGSYLSGKAPTKILNKRVILATGKDLEEYKADVERGAPQEIVYAEDDYDSESLAVKTDPTVEHHIETTNFDSWFEKQGLKYVEDYMELLETKYTDGGGKLVDNENIRKEDNKRGFQIQTAGIVEKTNRLNHGLRELYAESNRDSKLRSIKSVTLIKNTFDEHYDNKRHEQRQGIKPQAREKIKKDRDMWSADFNDQELRSFVVSSGIEREKNRQKLSLEEMISHEVIIAYAASLGDHTSVEDPNHNGKNYALSIGYEYHVSKLNKNLNKWTFDAYFERQLAKYEVAPEINGRFEDSSLKLGVNYYFVGNPDRLNEFAWYVGTGIKMGQSKMESFLIESAYDYEVSGFPLWTLGLKYRFRAGDDVSDVVRLGFGLNLKMTYETVKYSITNSEIGQNIDGSVQVNDAKFSIGMSVYF